MMADKTGHQDAKHAAKPHKASKEQEAQETPEVANEAEDEAGQKSGFADPLEFLRAELERVEAEKAEAQDRLMRLAAEMENLRKRTAKDVADAKDYSVASFAREMLAVSDNLRRALEAVPAETREAADPGFNALVEGVELTERAMLQGLEKHGVKRISPAGERFDPNFHQAMFEVQDPDVPANTVSQVVQDGYVIGERVLRPALVGVSKGGPKAPPRQDATVAGPETDEAGE
ncbi:MAG: nucleotide exchange factor GrpE [Nitratireductor sp.]|nr:nucleotide exchange factor GrpE [Nitratireductor sp.]